jgi:hypothetical protein
MATSKRSGEEKQEDIWIAHTELAVAPGHPFYKRLNELLEGAGFDEFVEGLCARFYHARLGRPSLRPGVYFRALLVGYFEGIDSERGIAWRVADSQELTPAAGRADRTQLRALLRDRRNATLPSAGAAEHSETAVDPRGSVQPESDSAKAAGRGHAAGAEKSRWGDGWATFALSAVPNHDPFA